MAGPPARPRACASPRRRWRPPPCRPRSPPIRRHHRVRARDATGPSQPQRRERRHRSGAATATACDVTGIAPRDEPRVRPPTQDAGLAGAGRHARRQRRGARGGGHAAGVAGGLEGRPPCRPRLTTDPSHHRVRARRHHPSRPPRPRATPPIRRSTASASDATAKWHAPDASDDADPGSHSDRASP